MDAEFSTSSPSLTPNLPREPDPPDLRRMQSHFPPLGNYQSQAEDCAAYPKQQQRSYRDSVRGVQQTMENKNRRNYVEEGLVSVSCYKGNPYIPSINVEPKLVEELSRPWERALVVTVVGKNVGYLAFSRRIKELWQPMGDLEVLDLGCNFFLAKFAMESDLTKVMLGGPWVMQGHYITLQKWRPDFFPSKATISSTMVWVRLPELPLSYYEEDMLMTVASVVGRPVKVDRTTELATRGKFARVCVEVDLLKPLVAQFWLNGCKFLVEYENLQNICFGCGMYGHLREACKKTAASQKAQPTPAMPQKDKDDSAAARVQDRVILESGQQQGTNMSEEPTDGAFGPWMAVMRRRRPYRARDIAGAGPSILAAGNRFASLQSAAARVPEGSNPNVQEGTKENNEINTGIKPFLKRPRKGSNLDSIRASSAGPSTQHKEITQATLQPIIQDMAKAQSQRRIEHNNPQTRQWCGSLQVMLPALKTNGTDRQENTNMGNEASKTLVDNSDHILTLITPHFSDPPESLTALGSDEELEVEEYIPETMVEDEVGGERQNA